MSNWYFYDGTGRIQGPYSIGQLQQFAQQGAITPNTPVATEGRAPVAAGTIPGLTFSGPVPPGAAPSVGGNPFAAPTPVAPSPFSAPQPMGIPVPVMMENKSSSGKVLVGILKVFLVLILLAAIGGTVIPIIRGAAQLKTVSRSLIEEELARYPLTIAGISIDWQDKPTPVDTIKSFWISLVSADGDIDGFASGNFTVKTTPSEKLYKTVRRDDAIRELGFKDIDEKAFNDALSRFGQLPKAYQGNLSIPPELSQFRFYAVLVSEWDEVTLTGGVKLVLDNEGIWQSDGVEVDPLEIDDDFTPESKLKDAARLDDPKTKEAVWKIMTERKDFIAKVDVAHDRWGFDDAIEKGFAGIVDGLPLEVAAKPTAESIKWNSRGGDSASGTFAVKAKTKENLFERVDRKAALTKLGTAKELEADVRRLGIAEIFEKEVYESDILNVFEFYDLPLSKGSDVTLTGSIELTKSDGKWKGTARLDSVEPALDGLLPEPMTRNAYKLDDASITKTKSDVKALLKRCIDDVEKMIKHMDDFDRFCKPGMKYEGSFDFGDRVKVAIEFKEYADRDKTAVKGTIMFEPPDPRKRGNVTRPFIIATGILKEADSSVTGEISNAELQERGVFVARFAPIPDQQQLAGIVAFWNLMDQCTDIKIEFDRRMKFSILCRPRLQGAGVPNEIDVTLSEGRDTSKEPLLPRNREWIIPPIKNWVEKSAGARPGTPANSAPGRSSGSSVPIGPSGRSR